jgi:hypothetical protein
MRCHAVSMSVFCWKAWFVRRTIILSVVCGKTPDLQKPVFCLCKVGFLTSYVDSAVIKCTEVIFYCCVLLWTIWGWVVVWNGTQFSGEWKGIVPNSFYCKILLKLKFWRVSSLFVYVCYELCESSVLFQNILHFKHMFSCILNVYCGKELW